MTTTQQAGPVTIDDVRQALGGTDPHATNAGKLRSAIGRGSVGTVQRHLEAIRAEVRAAAQPTAGGAVPPMPADAAASIWAHACAAAETLLRRRLDAVSAERDTLAAQVAEQRADVLALAEQVDAAERRADEAAAAADAAQRAAAVAEEARAAAAHTAQIEQAQHAAELQRVEHDRAVERQALQAALDRAVERHAEALGLLHALRPAS